MSLPADAGEIALAAQENQRRSRQLYRLGLGAALATVAYYIVKSDIADPLHLYLGIVIVGLAFYPALRWARVGNFQFPVFEVFMLTTVTAYALPLLNGHSQLKYYDSATISLAGLLVIIFQGSAIVAFYWIPARPGRGTFWTAELVSTNSMRFLRAGVVACTLHSYASQFTDWIPYEVSGEVRAVFFGVGIVSSFVLARMWGQGVLVRGDRVLLAVMLSIQVILSVSSLVMISGISTLLLAVLGYISGGRKVPLLLLVPSLVFFAILHNGKSQMRERYWSEARGGQVQVPLGDLPAFYAEWSTAGLAGGGEETAATSKIIDRASLFHIVCLVVSRTPEYQDYLYGQTYGYIPGQFVPRFLWPGKPEGHVATNAIGIYYGMIDQESTLKTTIAIGLLAEAYANFGLIGGVLIGAFMGFFLRKATGLAALSPMLSPGGLLLVVLMAWSFQTELTLSIWLSSLFQALVAVVALPLLVRRFLGG
jgi:hypothetical protein